MNFGQNHLFPIVALMISAGMFFGYINPTWNGSIASTKAAIASDNQVLASARQYAAQQNQLASERNAIPPADMTALENLLPDSVDNVQTILDLNAIAARSGLSITSADVAQGQGASGSTSGAAASAVNTVGSVDLSLQATGSFAALQTFLRGVESNQRLLDVESLNISGSTNGVYAYQLHVRLYWLR